MLHLVLADCLFRNLAVRRSQYWVNMQVTAPAKKLQRWQQRVRDNPVDFYVANRRVVHTRNWLIRVSKHLQTDTHEFFHLHN